MIKKVVGGGDSKLRLSKVRDKSFRSADTGIYEVLSRIDLMVRLEDSQEYCVL